MSTQQLTGRQLTIPHGTFYSLVTQAIANTSAAQAIALEVEGDILYLTHDTVTNNSRIYVPYDGSYEVIFSGICDSAAAANKHIEVWFAVGGSYVTDSNTRVQITSATTEMTVAVSAILDIDAGDYVELYTWGDSTDCRWLATAAGSTPTRPAVPSVIVTVKMINGYN